MLFCLLALLFCCRCEAHFFAVVARAAVFFVAVVPGGVFAFFLLSLRGRVSFLLLSLRSPALLFGAGDRNDSKKTRPRNDSKRKKAPPGTTAKKRAPATKAKQKRPATIAKKQRQQNKNTGRISVLLSLREPGFTHSLAAWVRATRTTT